MLVYKTDENYYVHLEEDGDDIWVSVLSQYCEEDFLVGSTDESKLTISDYIYNAYSDYYPAIYVKKRLDNNSDRSAVLHVATTAFEIDRALEEAYDAAKVNEYIFQIH